MLGLLCYLADVIRLPMTVAALLLRPRLGPVLKGWLYLLGESLHLLGRRIAVGQGLKRMLRRAELSKPVGQRLERMLRRAGLLKLQRSTLLG